MRGEVEEVKGGMRHDIITDFHLLQAFCLVRNPTTKSERRDEMKTFRFVIFLLVLLVVPVVFYSCATSEVVTGNPIDAGLVAKIVNGETNEDQIISWFGAPATTSQLGDNVLYIYKYCVSKGTGIYGGYFSQSKTEAKCDELTVTFDKATGKVKVHNFIKRVQE